MMGGFQLLIDRKETGWNFVGSLASREQLSVGTLCACQIVTRQFAL